MYPFRRVRWALIRHPIGIRSYTVPQGIEAFVALACDERDTVLLQLSSFGIPVRTGVAARDLLADGLLIEPPVVLANPLIED